VYSPAAARTARPRTATPRRAAAEVTGAARREVRERERREGDDDRPARVDAGGRLASNPIAFRRERGEPDGDEVAEERAVHVGEAGGQRVGHAAERDDGRPRGDQRDDREVDHNRSEEPSTPAGDDREGYATATSSQ